MTRQQVDAARLAHDEEMALKQKAARPRFRVLLGHIDQSRQTFDLMNTGASVSDLNVTLNNGVVDGIVLSRGGTITSGEIFAHLFVLDVAEGRLAQIDIHYRDTLGMDGSISFTGECKDFSQGYFWAENKLSAASRPLSHWKQ